MLSGLPGLHACDTRALARTLCRTVWLSTHAHARTHTHTRAHTHAHTRTPTRARAHQDIAPFLQKLAQRLGKSKQELCIWDPYYCAGKVKAHLRKLGFTNVVNENKDFYALTEYPPFDVLLTSPPYSKNHIQKCMEFAVSCGKAWFILQVSVRARTHALVHHPCACQPFNVCGRAGNGAQVRSKS